MSDNSSRHVAYEQVKLMLDFMGQHVEFATGQQRTLEARHTSKRLWRELAQTLNSCRGPRKTADGWSRYWSDFKNKLKKKFRIINKRKRLGSTADKGIRPLTKLEKRAIVILGPFFEKKVSQLAQQDCQDADTHKLPPVTAQVKIESVDELSGRPGHIEISPLAMSPRLESPDRQSEEEPPSEYDDSNPNEPTITSLYPKWLVEIEQKRAEAELARARAEESRARVAATAAQAANIQAEALRTLAEAASKQADAVARIAATLDSMHRRRPAGVLDAL